MALADEGGPTKDELEKLEAAMVECGQQFLDPSTDLPPHLHMNCRCVLVERPLAPAVLRRSLDRAFGNTDPRLPSGIDGA